MNFTESSRVREVRLIYVNTQTVWSRDQQTLANTTLKSGVSLRFYDQKLVILHYPCVLAFLSDPLISDTRNQTCLRLNVISTKKKNFAGYLCELVWQRHDLSWHVTKYHHVKGDITRIHSHSEITGQNVQKLQILLLFASSIARILKLKDFWWFLMI